jgi:outer membrane receptor protein involved in Fe transport
MKYNDTKRIVVSLLLFLMMEALPILAFAQTGRLTGKVTDAATGAPIPGATVLLEGTTLGYATDAEGRYLIIGIPPGTYNVRFSSVGYTTKVVEGFRVVSDRTQTLDQSLAEQVVEGGEVLVEAIRPVVDANQTTSRSLVTGDEISRLPVTSLNDVLAKTSNSYKGFVRGSRPFETKTILEGIDISDSYSQINFTAGGQNVYRGLVYSNTARADQTSNSLISINPDAVEEVTVNTGANEARYASASGGVVAVTLAEGRGALRGNASFRMAPSINRPGPDSLDFYFDGQKYLDEKASLQALNNVKANLYTWNPDKYSTGADPEMDFRFTLQGGLTDKLGFFATGQFFETSGFMPNQYSKRMNGQVKLNYDLGKKTKITALGMYEDRGYWGGWSNRGYQEFWRFYLEGVAENDGGSYVGSVKLTHVFNPKSYLDLQVYNTYSITRYGYRDADNNKFIDFSTKAQIDAYVSPATAPNTKFFNPSISDPGSDSGIFLPAGNRYKLSSPVPYYERVENSTTGFKLDYANQVVENHFIQAGAELKLRNFQYEEAYGVDGISFTLNGVNEPFIPSQWERNPTEVALYLSDRMEYAGLIVNAGLRVDVVDRNMYGIADHFYPYTRTSFKTEDGRTLLRNHFLRDEKVPVDIFFNPSLGVSHPIGTTAAMYFSYSRSQQLAPYSVLYEKYDGNHSTSQFFTFQDPNQGPITSNNYELGVQWEVSEGWGLDVNAYMRSVANYSYTSMIANNRIPTALATSPDRVTIAWHTFRTGFGYADIRGIEFVLRRRPLKLAENVMLGLTGSYTFGATEVSSGAGVNVQNFTAPAGSGPLKLPFENSRDFKNYAAAVAGGASALTNGYNRTHRGVVRATASLPFNISMGLAGSMESGFEYGRVVGADPRDRELLVAPYNAQVDLRLEKRFNLASRFGLDVYVDAINLTNRNNLVAYESYTPNGPAVFQTTGNPGTRLTLPEGSTIYGPARNIYFGTRARF